MVKWKLVLEDSSVTQFGELTDIKSHKLDIVLNKVRTAQFNLRLDNPLAPYLTTGLETEPLFLKMYRDGELMFHGEILTSEEVGDENQNATLQVNASGPEYIFTEALVGLTAQGLKFAAGTQRAVRFKELVQEYGARAHALVRIDTTSGPISSTNTGAYESPPFRYLSDVLQDMYNSAEGFDWIVYPQELNSGDIGRLVIKDLIHEEKPGAVFEWGSGRKNVGKFSRKVDRTQQANVGWNITSAGPEATGAPTIKKEAPAANLEDWGRKEALISANVLNEAMRNTLVEESINVRQNPRKTFTMTPVLDDGSGRVPVFGSDYNIGDGVRARIVYEGSTRLDGMVRVWGVSFDVNENSTESQSLTLSDG